MASPKSWKSLIYTGVDTAQGLTKADLMGDLAMLLQLPAYQLALPFFPQDQRRLALVEYLSGIAS